jgi:RimJ/RimL family protein N-acetyltransferase
MLQGERVVLRAVEREHLPNYVRWLNDETVLEWLGAFLPMSLAQEEAWYADMVKDPGRCIFAVELDGKHIGGCGLEHIDGRNRSAEMGLFIGLPELWDRGLGLDIVQTLLRFGFNQLNLHRIYLRVFADNPRAIHVYEKAGFQHEGRLRQSEFRHGRYYDMLWMSVLRSEWVPVEPVRPSVAQPGDNTPRASRRASTN